MADFVFVTWDGGGNQPPALALAAALQARGHTVHLAGYAAQSDRITQRGLPFELLEQSQAAWQSKLGSHLWQTFLEGILVCQPQLEELPQVIARHQDAVFVIDCMQFGALTAAESAQVPTAVLVHSAPGALLHPDRILAREVLAPLNALRASTGLPALNQAREAWTFAPTLCATIRELDPLAADAPPGFEYVGPIFDRMPRSGWRAPWSAGDPRPLVVASFSTDVAWDQRSRIERTVQGLAGAPYRALVTTGEMDTTGLEAQENVTLVRYVPHAEVLPGAAVLLTHAGHGSICAALAHGVPLVCLPNPIIADQQPLAAQVEALGAGRSLDGESATAAEIAGAVDAVMHIPSYQLAAQSLATVIAAHPGVTTTAARLERLAETTKGS